MRYDTSSYRKHKRPGNWGAPCPEHVTQAHAQALLESAAVHEAARYNVDGEYCYRAFSHGRDAHGNDLWHGHPVPWSRLPAQARKDLEARGVLTSATFRKALRKNWGAEFER